MTRADDAILEFLLNEGNQELICTPSVLEMNIEFGISTVRSRLRRLHEAGLVEYFDPDKGAYQISEKGKQYLAGELDADALEQSADSDS
ncbi:winged helix-turn-helix domain-containing protein [Natronosalvus amylolyticus]|uniref:winged helix-turn-helix domain-containing protein n=1 Tax=Natronosalvus amylolyticus TaxID=2961994 RepID=UPI0020C98943|nr:winged helix-turn-helix domain-containing protein [Natronosalvus amylolyticus]